MVKKQILVNEIIQVSNSKPAIKEIITARVVTKVLDQEILKGKILVQGIINITILYFANTPTYSIQNLHAQMDFDQLLFLQNPEVNYPIQTDLFVEKFQLELINPQTVETKILLNFQDLKNFSWTSAHYLS